jgi:hypothetical protein
MEILSQRFDEDAERIYKNRGVAEEKSDAGCKNYHPAIKDPGSLTAHSDSPVEHLHGSNAGASCWGP